MRASKLIVSILHRGFDKIKEDGRVMVIDEKSAEKLFNRLYLVKKQKVLTRLLLRTKVVHIKTSYHLLING